MSATATPPVGSDGGLFTRQSSGLVRELGIPAAVAIALGTVVVVNGFINFNIGLSAFKQADMILPLILAAVIWLIAMFAYRYLLTAVPRAGGEYVYLSRIISPAAGAMVGIGVAVVFTYTLSANAHFAAQFTPFMLQGLGRALHSSAITNAADDVTGKTAVVLISVGVLALVAGATALSLRSLARVILVLVLLQVLAVAVMAVLFIGHSQGDFASAFARYSDHPGAYGDVLAGAHKSGVLFGTSLAGMLGVVPFMVLSYNGVLYSYYVGGELKRPNKTYVSASAISLGLMVVFWVGTWLLMRHTVGLHFMQAQAGMDPAAYDKISSLTPLSGGIGYGMVLSGDPVTKILFATAFPLAQVTADLAFITVVTRVLFAAAFDRLLPVGVAKVSERTHAPTIAIAIALVVGAGFAVLTTYVDISNIVANLALFTALIILLASLACTALPFRRPDLILKPGAADVERWMGVPKIALVGLASTIVAGITVALIIAKPSVFGKFSVVSVASLVVVFGSGPVIYAISRAVRWRRSSIDLKLALHSLPPE